MISTDFGTDKIDSYFFLFFFVLVFNLKQFGVQMAPRICYILKLVYVKYWHILVYVCVYILFVFLNLSSLSICCHV